MSLKEILVRANKCFKEDSLRTFLKRAVKVLFIQYNLKQRDISYQLLKLKARNGFLVRNIQGSKMYLDLRDQGISKELALDGIREERATKMMQKKIKEGDIVVDIGANIGYYALLEARLVGKNGKVYAIEPVPRNVKLLKKNVSINNYQNVEVFDFAIGNKNGWSNIYLSSKLNWHSMISLKRLDIVGSRKVKVCTLDTFLKDKEYPNLVRMDVEGYEGKVIKGMINTLKKNKPLKLFIEIHPHNMKKDEVIFLLKTLKKYNFEIKMIAKRSARYMWTIDDLLHDELMLEGKKGGFQIFLKRK